jgi:hypothetical protein
MCRDAEPAEYAAGAEYHAHAGQRQTMYAETMIVTRRQLCQRRGQNPFDDPD